MRLPEFLADPAAYVRELDAIAAANELDFTTGEPDFTTGECCRESRGS